MTEFNYILNKINDAPFQTDPFKFLYIEDFFSKEHFEEIVSDQQIDLEEVDSTEELMKLLVSKNYKPVPFPGCTTDINQYVKWYNGRNVATPGHAHGLIEGFGLAFRMQKYDNPLLERLMTFLNSDIFYNTIMAKFGKYSNRDNTYVETAIQKYVSGYEISPHPDIRKKVLTYMLNINPAAGSESLGMSTHFQKFTEQKSFLYDLWKDKNIERFWVPWDWSETVWEQKANNSITMFAPDNDTLHAVKLDYDHTKTQRTQVYGNVWYNKSSTKIKPTWRDYA